MEKYLTENEIVLDDYESVETIQKVLLNNGYVVMVSREESFWIVNYIWDCEGNADRHAVVFLDRAQYEWEEERKNKEEGDN